MQEIGVVHSNGVDAFHSLNPMFDYSILCSEGTMGVKSPATVVKELEDRFYTNMTKRTVVIVEGSFDWLRMYKGTIDNADVMVYLGSLAELRRLGIPVLDGDWEPGDAPLVLQEFVASRLAAMDEGMVPVDEPVELAAEDHPVETGTPTESSADDFGFAEDPLDQPVKTSPLDLLGEMTQQVIGSRTASGDVVLSVSARQSAIFDTWMGGSEALDEAVAAGLRWSASRVYFPDDPEAIKKVEHFIGMKYEVSLDYGGSPEEVGERMAVKALYSKFLDATGLEVDSDPRRRARRASAKKVTAGKVLALVRWAFADEATPEEIAAALWLEASDARATVESDIRGAVAEEGGEMRGLEWAVKSQDSIERKLREKYLPRGLMGDDLAGALQDVLRFTAVFHPADYSNSVQRTLWHLQAAGYQILGEDNSWAPGDVYDALHYVLSGPMASVPIELQFHTEETWTLKELKQHVLYEELRDPQTTMDRQQELWDTMANWWEDIERPANADQFPGLKLYPRPASRREASFHGWCDHCAARKEAYLSEEGFKSKKQWRMCFSGAWDGVDQDQCKQYAELVEWDELPEYVEGD